MPPNIVTFWDGPLDSLRHLCLTSQVCAGHRVAVYSYSPLPGLPHGVENADAELILPRAFAEKLRPSAPDGSWTGWTPVQFSDFFRMRLMQRRSGLWLDADVLLLKPLAMIDPAAPLFGWEKPRQLGNSVLYLPPHSPIVNAFEALMQQDVLAPDWLSLRHRLTFKLRKLRDRSLRLSDLRVALYGPPALTSLARQAGQLRYARPQKAFYSVHADPTLFFEPSDFGRLVDDPEIYAFHISPKTRRGDRPTPGSFHAWATRRFETA